MIATDTRTVTGTNGVTVELLDGEATLIYDGDTYLTENFQPAQPLQARYEAWKLDTPVEEAFYRGARLDAFLRANGFREAARFRPDTKPETSLLINPTLTIWERLEEGDKPANNWSYIQTDGEDGVVTIDTLHGKIWEHDGNYAVPLYSAVRPTPMTPAGQNLSPDERETIDNLAERWSGDYDGEGMFHFTDETTLHPETLTVDESGAPTIDVTVNESGLRVQVHFLPPYND